VIAPFAVRSMPMLRDTASGLTETDPIVVPEVCDRRCGQMPGTIKEAQISGNATTEVGA
jgi:hypothetical protein